jgi:large subunit ribosomal protein L13
MRLAGPTIIDANGLVVGRLATQIAKKVLAGEDVMVVNAEKSVIVGRREDIYADYFEKFNRGDWHGPWIPRMPDQLFRRIVRGMLPYKRARGRDAWRRLQAYIGVPRGVEIAKAVRIEAAVPSGSHPAVPLEDVSRYLGARWHDAPTILPHSRLPPEEKARRRAEAKAAFEAKRKPPAKEEGAEKEPEKAKDARPKTDAKPAGRPAPKGEKAAETERAATKQGAKGSKAEKSEKGAKSAAAAKEPDRKVK